MTREDIKTINDIVHKTIYQFFDGDEEEAPMSDKDELLLAVNKAICNNIKALEQEPCEDTISRQAVLKLFATHDGKYLFEAIRDLPSVTPKQRTGHWIECEDEVKCFCSECKEISDYPTKFCPNCGAKMVEPHESEVSDADSN